MGYAFCFQQHDNVTRQSYFFNPSSTYLRLNQDPITPDVTVFFFHIYKQLLFFFGNSVYVYFRGDLQYSLSISLTLHKNLNFVSTQKKGQYFKDNTFLGFIKPYRRQVFPNEKRSEGSTINQESLLPSCILVVNN